MTIYKDGHSYSLKPCCLSSAYITNILSDSEVGVYFENFICSVNMRLLLIHSGDSPGVYIMPNNMVNLGGKWGEGEWSKCTIYTPEVAWNQDQGGKGPLRTVNRFITSVNYREINKTANL